MIVPVDGARLKPRSGSAVVCTRCGELSVLELELEPVLRKATGRELAALRRDHVDFWHRLMTISGRAKRGGGASG